jgi:hypothetical protein
MQLAEKPAPSGIIARDFSPFAAMVYNSHELAALLLARSLLYSPATALTIAPAI